MINEFISGGKNTQKIKELFETEEPLKCAVAFWGKKAEELLDNSKSSEIKIICNLESGATNPFLMEKLLKLKKEKPLNIHIKTKHNLHAKVYIAGNQAIIGSSNVSSNGLSLEDEEQQGYEEASIITSDEKIIKSANAWFEDLWSNFTTSITKKMLDKAKEKWKSKRKTRVTNTISSGGGSLFEELRKNPSEFKDRDDNIVLAIHRANITNERALEAVEKANNRYFGTEIAAYEYWDSLPEDSYLIVIMYDSNKIFSFWGIYKTDFHQDTEESFEYENGEKGKITVAFKKKVIRTNLRKYKITKKDKELLKDKIEELWELAGEKNVEGNNDTGRIISLYDAKDYLIA